MTRLNQVQVATSWNQTLSDSDNIEDFTPNVGTPIATYIGTTQSDLYCFVRTKPTYSRGEQRFDSNSALSFAGLETVTYTQPDMHRDTLAWLIANYEGQVSVNLTKNSSVYSDWNANLHFEWQDSGGDWLQDVRWVFRIVSEIT